MSDIYTEVVVLPAACLRSDIAASTRQLEAGIAEMTQGRTIVGPVKFDRWHGRDACRSTLHSLYADDLRPVVRFGLDQFDAFFDENPTDCILIVGNAEVRA